MDKQENEAILKFERLSKEYRQKIEEYIDARYDKLVNKSVYESNLAEIHKLQEPHKKIEKKYHEVMSMNNDFLYGVIPILIAGGVFFYDLLTGRNILPNFNIFWYWVTTIACLIIGIGSLPILLGAQRQRNSEASEKLSDIEHEIDKFKKVCEKELEPFYEGFGVNDVFDLIRKLNPNFYLFPFMETSVLATLKEITDYKDQLEQNENVKHMVFGFYKKNPFMIYDVLRCDLKNWIYSNSKDVSWDTKDEKEDIHGYKTITTTTHTQTLVASVESLTPFYSTYRVFELWNPTDPQMSYKIESIYNVNKSDQNRKKFVEKMDKKMDKKSTDKLFNKFFQTTTDQHEDFGKIYNEDTKKQFIEYGMYSYQELNTNFSIEKKGCKYNITSDYLQDFMRIDEFSVKFMKDFDYPLYKENFVRCVRRYIDSLVYLLAPFDYISNLDTQPYVNHKPTKLPYQYVSSLIHESIINDMDPYFLLSSSPKNVIYKTSVYGTLDYLDVVKVDASYWVYDMKRDKMQVKDNDHIYHSIMVDYPVYSQESKTIYVNIKPCPPYFRYDHFLKLVNQLPDNEKINKWLSQSVFSNNCIAFKDNQDLYKADNDLLNTLIFYNE